MRATGVRRAATVCALLAGCTAAGLGTGSAQAADGYRYWSFWEQTKKSQAWSYATQGPSVLRPDDGAVLGFRFALSEDSEDAASPRGDAEFEAICGRTEKKPDRKRVALAVDFGTTAHAPRGENPPSARTACARVAEDASAAEALAAVAKPLRYNSDALLCAIEGYPRRGCGERLSGDGASKEKDKGKGDANGSDGGLPPVAGIGAGVAAVAVLAVAAVRQTRRRR
ncbi:MAG: SCO2322 family protein [Streptomyces sp.]|uniref:SCO2322 family protein n=1 Tax=Streptomyces sp. TaxID=1931 RepID=UPI003D6B44A5